MADEVSEPCNWPGLMAERAFVKVSDFSVIVKEERGCGVSRNVLNEKISEH